MNGELTLEALDMDRCPALRVPTLRANVTAYDALHVALAETLGCELSTADQRLAGAPGPACAFRVLR